MRGRWKAGDSNFGPRRSQVRAKRSRVDRPRRRRGRLARKMGLVLLILAAVVAVKAVQNRRDVAVPIRSAAESVAAWRSTVSDSAFHIDDPYAVDGEWYQVQLHTHTRHSLDARWEVADSLLAYANAGYDFVAISDHDKIIHPAEVPPSLIHIPAEENTVSFPFWPLGQHAVILFADEHIRNGSAAARWEAAERAGSLVQIAHPNWTGNLGSGVWEVKHLYAADAFHLMEVFNPHSDTERDVALWHEMLVLRGPARPVWAVAVDDAHDLNLFHSGWTMVKASSRSLEGLKEALLRGSLYPTTGVRAEFGVDGESIYATALDVDEGRVEMRFIDASGRVVYHTSGAGHATYTPTGAEGFIRIEIIDHASRARAWSQPFWLR